jgi:hypothetical protein
MNCRMETAASVMSFLHQVYDDRVSVSESRLLSPVCFLQPPVSRTNLSPPECWVSRYGTCMCYISRSTRTSIVTDPRAWKYPKEEAQLLPFTYISFVREWVSKLPWDGCMVIPAELSKNLSYHSMHHWENQQETQTQDTIYSKLWISWFLSS